MTFAYVLWRPKPSASELCWNAREDVPLKCDRCLCLSYDCRVSNVHCVVCFLYFLMNVSYVTLQYFKSDLYKIDLALMSFWTVELVYKDLSIKICKCYLPPYSYSINIRLMLII